LICVKWQSKRASYVSCGSCNRKTFKGAFKAFVPSLNWNEIIGWRLFREYYKKSSSERINGNLFAELGTFPANNSVILFHTYGISSIADRLSKPSALIANYMRCFHKVSNSGLNFFSRDIHLRYIVRILSANGNTSYQKNRFIWNSLFENYVLISKYPLSFSSNTLLLRIEIPRSLFLYFHRLCIFF